MTSTKFMVIKATRKGHDESRYLLIDHVDFADRPAALGYFLMMFLLERPGSQFDVSFSAVEGNVIAGLKRAGHVVEAYHLKGMEYGETLRAILATQRGDLRYFVPGQSDT